MRLSRPAPKFLLDENVRIELHKFLKDKNFDVKLVPKGASDKFLATISKEEGRVLVTNDEDFCQYAKNQLFAVILLKIPQNDSKALLNSSAKLLKNLRNFEGRVVILKPNSWDDFPLGEFVGLDKGS